MPSMGSTFAATGLVLAVLAATGSCRSHHRLTIPVPPQLVPFNSSAGMALLLEPQTAQASFFSLVQELATQETQSYCGVASAATMLNALPNVPAPVDPVFSPHPYFTQDSFFSDCVNKVVPSSTVKLVGMTLDQWHAAVHCWGPTVATTHASDSSVDAFRTAASTALAKGRARVVINFDRKGLWEEGGGHFSPLGAYNAQADRFLVLDVARYKYPPVWAKTADIFASMNTTDSAAQLSRGYAIVHEP